ncbi:MAG: aminoacyl-tRNA hydrolase [Actinomycetaceae bacterium]|nr:aminoacyl-tRNA hydrolase [Actinomycetaceae bacterium]
MPGGGFVMIVIVGLGNPGADYEGTRHNCGHMVIDELCRRWGVSLKRIKGTKMQAAQIVIRGEKAWICQCETFMNTSGDPVRRFLDYFHVDPTNLLVVHDDMDLAFGTLRMKRGGGEGGHNGLKSISQYLGTQDYMRLRVAIGRPHPGEDPAHYVLGHFPRAQHAEVERIVCEAAEAAEQVITDGFLSAQQKLNSAHPHHKDPKKSAQKTAQDSSASHQ